MTLTSPRRGVIVWAMQLTIIMKLRIAAVVAVGLLLFGKIGWQSVEPTNADGVATVAMGGQSTGLIVKLVLLWLVTVGLAAILAWPYAAELTPVAVAAGLGGWAVFTVGMDRLLLQYSETAVRAKMFQNLTIDVAIWSGMVIAAALLGQSLFGKKRQPAEPTKTNGDKKKFAGLLADPKLNTVAALLIGSAAAVILLKILVQSGRAYLGEYPYVPVAKVPQLGQVVWGVFVAFLLAAMAAHQLFRQVGLGWLLIIPPIVAISAYLTAAAPENIDELQNAAATFIQPSLIYAAVLPVQYAGFGSLGVITGFWLSVRAHRLRQQVEIV